jgi:predicted transcriptional regulator
MEREIKFKEVKELIEKYPDEYVNITAVATKTNINWRTAKKYIKRLRT